MFFQNHCHLAKPTANKISNNMLPSSFTAQGNEADVGVERVAKGKVVSRVMPWRLVVDAYGRR